MDFRKNPHRKLNHLVSMPFTYAVSFGLVALDILAEIYHRVCFPLLGIECVKRSQYIRFDRHELKYLTVIEKINCFYCSYANGLLGYTSEIAARTEKYWCGIQHEKTPGFKTPKHHQNFLPYNDEKAFNSFLKK